MSANVTTIVNGAIEIVGQVAGTGVQVYAEPFAYNCVRRSFDLLFKKRFWPQYVKWHRLALDGTLGIVTTNALENVRDFEDFGGIFDDESPTPLPVWPTSRNPYGYTGTQVMYWTMLNNADTNFTQRRLQFYPVTSTGFVNIMVRQHPLTRVQQNFGANDIIYLDQSLMEEATAFLMFMSDGLNPDAAQATKSMMDTRYKTIVASLGRHPLSMGRPSHVPLDWYPAA